jgi:hypothetical protein
MTTIGTSLQQGMDALSRVLGGPAFIWRGTTVSCIPATISDANSVIPGGFQPDIQTRILVKVQDWAAADSSIIIVDDTPFTVEESETPKPIIGRTLTYLGKSYRIVSAKTDPSGAFYRVDLASPRK